jgi:hypothetical protein
VRALAGSPHLASLTGLDLGENEDVGNPAVVALAESPHLNGLAGLGLGFTRVRAAGLWP